jgi:hypothetical protein
MSFPGLRKRTAGRRPCAIVGGAVLAAGDRGRGAARQTRRRLRAKVRGARRSAAPFDHDGWARRFAVGISMALDAGAGDEGSLVNVVLATGWARGEA